MRHSSIYRRNRPEPVPEPTTFNKRLTVRRVAERLGCSESHIYKLINSNELPHIKLGERMGIRVAADDVESFLVRKEREAESIH